MDGEDLYDEFGNYIGPDIAGDGDGDDQGYEERYENGAGAGGGAYGDDKDGAGADDAGASTDMIAHAGANAARAAIVLHEDKQYYPDAEEVYPGAETLVQDEDTQPITKPIIEPITAKQFSALEKEPPATTYTPEFLTTLMTSPALIRNVAIVGHLHHGKTSLCDVLIEHTHANKWAPSARPRYTDARKDEQQRGLSIKTTPVSLVLQTGGDKSYLVNVLDTPGHVNFSDEVTAAYRAADGVVLVVDAVEGVLMNTGKLAKHAIVENLPIVLVVAKVDRLLLELKLPPADAYFKLAHIVQEVNALIAAHTPGGVPTSGGSSSSNSSAAGERGGVARQRVLDPAAGNVLFAGCAQGWTFSLESFARVYASRSGGAGIDPAAFAARLWGDVYFNPATRKFQRKPHASGAPRSFVQFVLEPLYKLYSRVLGEGAETLSATLRELRIPHRRSELSIDPAPLLKLVLSRFLGTPSGFADMVVRHLPSPAEGAAAKLRVAYSRGGAALAASPEGAAMLACDPSGPLMVNVVKLLSSPDGESFYALGRVLSGTVAPGSIVRVLGESFTAEDEEDMAVRSVTAVSISQARYRLDVTSAPAGNLILLEGVDDVIGKTATLTDTSPESAEASTFLPLAFATRAVVNISVEPLNPAELPRVVAGLRRITKAYPLASTRVEESGEHVLSGTGELALDCIMHDLRLIYAGVEVKVADPVTSFAETVVDSSSIKCFADTPNKRNRLTMVAEPLDKGLAEDLEAGAVDIAGWDKRRVADFFSSKYDWDVLAARSVWAFGPSPSRGPNLLLDDTLAGEVDKAAVGSIRESLVQGFQWACREGPLCDEPIRNVKFKLLDATVAGEPIHRGGGQVIPTARRVAYSSMLLATPRLMEPVYGLEILAPPDAVQAIYAVLARRRGHIVSDAPVPGTPFYVVKGFVPVIDSFGFETDLRVHTQGLAFGLQDFDHWAIVPGDPLDKSIILRPLEPSPPPALAREFMVKTRRRKGLSEDVSVTKYFDEEMLLWLSRQEEAMEM